MPVFGIEPQRIADRADFLERVANDVLEGPAYEGLDLSFDAYAIETCAEAYFFLSEAYKAARIPANSRTKPPKQAAMSALAIGTIQPIRPKTNFASRQAVLYVNGALALRVGAGAIKASTTDWVAYERIRFYRMVQGMLLPSLNDLIADANANKGKVTNEFVPSLTKDELSKIDVFVAYMELLEHLCQ